MNGRRGHSTFADVMGQSQHIYGREGQIGQRPRDEIAYHAIRVGDNPGEHAIVFGMHADGNTAKQSSLASISVH